MRMILAAEPQLALVGGLTDTCFPTLQEWLEDSEHMKGLEYIASRKNMDAYRSVIDFVLCEVLTEYRKPCQRFYDRDGPNYVTLRPSKKDQAHDEAILLRAVIHSYVCFCQERKKSWAAMRREVLEASR